MTEGLDLTFEHIDWADIVDAEQSGDQEAIQELMYVHFVLIILCSCTIHLCLQGSIIAAAQRKIPGTNFSNSATL